MDRRYLCDPLPFKTPVINLLLLFEITVAAYFPILSPAFHPIPAVPPGRLDHAAFPLFPVSPICLLFSGNRIDQRDTFAMFIQQISLFLLQAPAAILLDWPHRRQCMTVRIPVAFIVDGQVYTHAFFHQRRKEVMQHPDLRFPVTLCGKGYFKFTGKLRVGSFLYRHHAVP